MPEKKLSILEEINEENKARRKSKKKKDVSFIRVHGENYYRNYADDDRFYIPPKKQSNVEKD